MPIYYWESSGLVKRYKPEIGTPVVYELFDGRGPGEDFATSYITEVEATSVLAREHRGGHLTNTTYREMRALLREDLAERLRVLPVSNSLLSAATELASEFTLRAADAIQLATALFLHEQTPSLCLVSSDRRVNEAASARRLRILNPENPSDINPLRQRRTSGPGGTR